MRPTIQTLRRRPTESTPELDALARLFAPSVSSLLKRENLFRSRPQGATLEEAAWAALDTVQTSSLGRDDKPTFK